MRKRKQEAEPLVLAEIAPMVFVATREEQVEALFKRLEGNRRMRREAKRAAGVLVPAVRETNDAVSLLNGNMAVMQRQVAESRQRQRERIARIRAEQNRK